MCLGIGIPATAVMSIFVLLAMGFGSKLFGTRFRTYTYATMALLLVFGLLTSFQGGRLADNQSTPWMGFEERVNIYTTMLWIVALAVGLQRAQRTEAGRRWLNSNPMRDMALRTRSQSPSARR